MTAPRAVEDWEHQCQQFNHLLGASGLCRDCARAYAAQEVAEAQREVARLQKSMVNHFQTEHLEGDGPEIDRWKARCARLEVRLQRIKKICLVCFCFPRLTVLCSSLVDDLQGARDRIAVFQGYFWAHAWGCTLPTLCRAHEATKEKPQNAPS